MITGRFNLLTCVLAHDTRTVCFVQLTYHVRNDNYTSLLQINILFYTLNASFDSIQFSTGQYYDTNTFLSDLISTNNPRFHNYTFQWFVSVRF